MDKHPAHCSCRRCTAQAWRYIFILGALVLTSILITITANANEYKVRNIEVYDGDTIKATVDTFPNQAFVGSIRINGIDTPEIHTRNQCEKRMGLNAKSALMDFLKGKSVTVSNVKNGKYAGRVLGDLHANGESAATYMLRKGYAKPYFGGKKDRNWCK